MKIEVVIVEAEVLLIILLTQEAATIVDLQRSTEVLRQAITDLTIVDLTTIVEVLVVSAGRATQDLMGILQAGLQEAEVAATIDQAVALRDLHQE